METNYQIIETETELDKITKSLEREKTVAIDLEADSMYHFKEKICLIQMATKNTNIVVDPLKIGDLSPLKPLFARHDTRKIFHGADYDVRSFYRDFKIEITNLFDTEIACRFLGVKETGLEAVLKNYFNIILNKKYQKKNWSVRPLPQEMIDYAAQDVIHLLPLAEKLIKELEKKERLSWVLEECDLLRKVRPALFDDKPLFLKFKGAGRLNSRSLAVLEALLQFRKKVAGEKDRPLFKIIGNNALMKVALSAPVSLGRLKGVMGLSKSQINMYGNAIVATVNAAIKIPEKDLPIYPRKKSPVFSHKMRRRLNALKEWRDTMANDLEIDPALVCNKALLTAIAKLNPLDTKSLFRIQGMKNWQKIEFGEEIVKIMRTTK